MRLRIHHATHYEYSAPVQYAIQALYLTPQSSAHQSVLSWQIHAPGTLFEQGDGYGNVTHTYSLSGQMLKGTIRAQGLVETHPSPWIVDAPALPSPLLYLRRTGLTAHHPPMVEFAAPHLSADAGEAELLALAREVVRQVTYRKGHTDVETTALEAFDWGKGVCQDQAHVFIAMCRAHGIPARYVSGYFYDAQAPELASHAWADVCIDVPAKRWLSIDVTHVCLIDQRHVRLAVGADYASCPPVKGVRSGGGDESMQVHIEMRQA